MSKNLESLRSVTPSIDADQNKQERRGIDSRRGMGGATSRRHAPGEEPEARPPAPRGGGAARRRHRAAARCVAPVRRADPPWSACGTERRRALGSRAPSRRPKGRELGRRASGGGGVAREEAASARRRGRRDSAALGRERGGAGLPGRELSKNESPKAWFHGEKIGGVGWAWRAGKAARG